MNSAINKTIKQAETQRRKKTKHQYDVCGVVYMNLRKEFTRQATTSVGTDGRDR